MANYSELLNMLHDVVEARTVEAGPDSKLFPWYGGDVSGQYLLFSREHESAVGNIQGFRQVTTFNLRHDRPKNLPHEPSINGECFVLGVLRGIEQDAPISQMVLNSFAMPHGEAGGMSEHLLVVDFTRNKAEYGIRPASSSIRPTHLGSRDRRMRGVLEFWTDQIEGAPFVPQQSDGSSITIMSRRAPQPSQPNRSLVPGVFRRMLGK